MSYLSDLDVEYDDGGEVEVEVEVDNDDSARGQLHERGQQLLQDLDPSRALELLGR